MGADAMQKKLKADKVFFKLSCRSPKDAGAREERMGKIYKEYAAECKLPEDPKEFTTIERNKAVELLYKSSLKALSVKDFKEAVTELFARSERIKFDLQLDLQLPKSFSLHLVCRPFEEIPMISEYRA